MKSNGSGPGGSGKLDVLLAIFDFPMLVAGYRSIIDGELDMRVVGEVYEQDHLRQALERTQADIVVAECLPFNTTGCTTFETIEQIRSVKPAIKDPRPRVSLWERAVQPRPEGRGRRVPHPGGRAGGHPRRPAFRQPGPDLRQSRDRHPDGQHLRAAQSRDGPLEDAYGNLSDREKEVLLLAAVGHTNREIAKVFHLSEQTIHNYRANIMEKLGFHDRMELLKYAIRRGIVSVADL